MMTQDLAVCQVQCDSIDPFNLPSVSSSNLGALPEVTAVYFLIRKRCVLYVGKAKNLRKRWQGHHKKEYAVRFGDTQVAWAVMPDCAQALAAERILIDEFMPQLNGIVPAYLKATPAERYKEYENRINRIKDGAKRIQTHLRQANTFDEKYYENIARILFYVQNDYQVSLRNTMAWLEDLAGNPSIHSSPISCEIHAKWNDLTEEFKSLFNTFYRCFLVGDYGIVVDDVELDFDMKSYTVLHGFHKNTVWEYPEEASRMSWNEMRYVRNILEEMESM